MENRQLGQIISELEALGYSAIISANRDTTALNYASKKLVRMFKCQLFVPCNLTLDWANLNIAHVNAVSGLYSQIENTNSFIVDPNCQICILCEKSDNNNIEGLSLIEIKEFFGCDLIEINDVIVREEKALAPIKTSVTRALLKYRNSKINGGK